MSSSWLIACVVVTSFGSMMVAADPPSARDPKPPAQTAEKTDEEKRAEAIAAAPKQVRDCVAWCIAEHRRQSEEQLKREIELTRRLLIASRSWHSTSAYVLDGWKERVNSKGKTEIVFAGTDERKRLMGNWTLERRQCAVELDALESGKIHAEKASPDELKSPSTVILIARGGHFEVRQVLGDDVAVIAYCIQREQDLRFVVHGLDFRNKVDDQAVMFPEEPMMVTTERNATVIGGSSQLYSLTPLSALLSHPAAADAMRAEGSRLKQERERRKVEVSREVDEITGTKDKSEDGKTQ